MEVSCTVDSIAGKMGLVSEQNVTNHMKVRFNPVPTGWTYPQVQDAECAGLIGRGGTRNWPPWSPDLNPLDYHVWGYMKAMVYAQKVNTGELLQRILSATRSVNNAAVLRNVTSSLVIGVRKCMQADGGHFEQFA